MQKNELDRGYRHFYWHANYGENNECGNWYCLYRFSTLLFSLHYTVEHNIIKALAFITLTYWLSGPPPDVCIGVSDTFLGVLPL